MAAHRLGLLRILPQWRPARALSSRSIAPWALGNDASQRKNTAKGSVVVCLTGSTNAALGSRSSASSAEAKSPTHAMHISAVPFGFTRSSIPGSSSFQSIFRQHRQGTVVRCQAATSGIGKALLYTMPPQFRHRSFLEARPGPQTVQQRGMAKKTRAKKHPPKAKAVQEPEYVVGQEYKVFTHETPTIFRLLLGTGATQLAVWTGVITNSLLGLSYLPVIPNWMIWLGTPMSAGLFFMVRWHATHHVAGITVIPGLADQILLTTHTMTGGLQTRKLLRYQVDMSDSAARPGKYRQVYIRGETWNYVMDTDGQVLDQRLFDLLMDNKPIPKA